MLRRRLVAALASPPHAQAFPIRTTARRSLVIHYSRRFPCSNSTCCPASTDSSPARTHRSASTPEPSSRILHTRISIARHAHTQVIASFCSTENRMSGVRITSCSSLGECNSIARDPVRTTAHCPLLHVVSGTGSSSTQALTTALQLHLRRMVIRRHARIRHQPRTVTLHSSPPVTSASFGATVPIRAPSAAAQTRYRLHQREERSLHFAS